VIVCACLCVCVWGGMNVGIGVDAGVWVCEWEGGASPGESVRMCALYLCLRVLTCVCVCVYVCVCVCVCMGVHDGVRALDAVLLLRVTSKILGSILCCSVPLAGHLETRVRAPASSLLCPFAIAPL